ncbi:DUF1616 domain-containing protein [Halomarina ordinaria]|uniref:DUF1616 domain-containing protein n=1 Tax=Halomarina ordinaria TaxID=3033939 RepID=A0ABD5UAW1_9EURY|nr:DUF1616 domain-containing protein [Halomarina sp. PSRA2]
MARSDGRERRLPTDLAVVVAALVAYAALAPLGLRETPLGVVLGLPFVLLLPGYVVVAALFPTATGGEAYADRSAPRLGFGERLLLSVGTSVLLTVALALALAFSRVDVTPLSTLTALGLATLLGTVVAAVRRARVRPAHRFSPDGRRVVAAVAAPLRARGRGALALNVVLVGCAVVALAGAGYALATVDESGGEAFTELSLEDGDGTRLADDTVAPGEAVTVGVTNQEGERTRYTLVVSYVPEDGGPAVEGDRRSLSLADGESASRTIAPTPPGEGSYRAEFLLYRGDAPERPVDEADEAVHVWVAGEGGP